MELFSLSFVFLALPAMFVLCLLSPVRLRPFVLLTFSALLYFSLEGKNLLLAAAVLLFDYAMLLLMARCGAFVRLRRAAMICSVVKSVGLMVFYSVYSQTLGAHIPLGLGVLCLTGTGYVVDAYNEVAAATPGVVEFALMGLFFPKLYAGPLVRGSELLPRFRRLHMTLEKTGLGAELFIRGLAKKVIIGDAVYAIYRELKEIPPYDLNTLSAWMLVIMLAFTTYFILSGYCDMAKGAGLIFGFELPDNFAYPYGATSVEDFFSRFNITVNKYIRRYVYFNLGGTEGSMLSGIFNILLVTILMGLWFGVQINLLIWGIYFAFFVVLERYFLRKHKEMIPTLFRWLYTAAVVLISFVILAWESPATSFYCLKLMLGIGLTTGGVQTLHLLTSNYLVLLLAVVCSTSLFRFVSAFLGAHLPRAWGIVSTVIHAALLVVTVAFML